MFNKIKCSNIFTIKSGTTPDTKEPSFYLPEKINWLNSGDFHNSVINKTKKKISISAKNYYGLKEFNINSIVIAMYGANIGEVGYLNIKSTVNQACAVLSKKISNVICEKYYFYWFIQYKENFVLESYGGGQQNINQKIISNTYIDFPPLEQQIAIANFLDIETSKIDKKIDLLFQKFEKLEEYKKSVIFETVTKGLDNSVPMKNSGIDWIGDIPTYWEVNRVKDILDVKKGNPFDDSWDSIEGVYPYINGGVNPSGWSNKINSKQNTIAVSEGGASAGFVQFMQIDYWAGSHCYKIKSQNSKMDNKYFYYLLKGFEQFLKFEKTGSAMPNLQKSRFLNYFVSFTSNRQEQNNIIYFLDSKISTIDKKVDIIKKQIELLKEYKQSIIYAYVTGKQSMNNINKNLTNRDNDILKYLKNNPYNQYYLYVDNHNLFTICNSLKISEIELQNGLERLVNSGKLTKEKRGSSGSITNSNNSKTIYSYC